MGQSNSSRRYLTKDGKLVIQRRRSASAILTNTPSAQFQPDLEFGLDPYGRLDLLQVGVLDVLVDFGPNLRKGVLLDGLPPRSFGSGPDELDDLGRLLDDLLRRQVIQVPTRLAGLLCPVLGRLILLLFGGGGQGVAEEDGPAPLFRMGLAAEDPFRQSIQAGFQVGVLLNELLVLQVHL